MILGVFCVFDSKAVTFGMPFFTQNRGSAQRGIQMQIRQDPNSMLAQYPSDFSLMEMGTYDDETGLFQTQSGTFVIKISDLVEANNEQQP
jgi:hypothetical protein